MVRKRSRKYESSDENDSDSDAEFSGGNGDKTSSSQPAAKRYSLRERRAPPPEFDFFGLAEEADDNDEDDNDDDDDGLNDLITKLSSDDEDFEVDLKKSKRKQKKHNSTNDDDDGDDYQDSDNEVATLPFKNCETTLESSTDNGLIDFEDIIRADIVVRKKIDYDHIIEKSTICLNSDKQASCSPKSKYFHNETNDEQLNIFEPHIETHTQMDDDDGNNLLNLESNMSATSLPNFINNEENSNKSELNGTDLQRNLDTIVNDSGGGGGGNNNNNVEDDEDDDVIVLGEVKQDIIVLDD